MTHDVVRDGQDALAKALRHVGNDNRENILLDELKRAVFVFESDFEPPELKRFISQFPMGIFGINYDTGNSASLGYQFQNEFKEYGDRILNVHIKDRLLGDTTVPLGTGNAKLPETIFALERQGFRGNYILQTARAVDGDHVGAICHYRDMVKDWVEKN